MVHARHSYTRPMLGAGDDIEQQSSSDSEFEEIVFKHVDFSASHGLMTLILRAGKVLLIKLLIFLLPSFLLQFVEKKAPAKARANLIPLDGLRGLACLMVLNLHWTLAVNDSYDGGSGAKNSEYFFHRPFWSILWGRKVDVFFIMSGYVLPIRCLKLIHSRSSIYQAIVSSVFRRAIRIFLPSIIMLFVYFVGTRMHCFDRANINFKSNRGTSLKTKHEYQLYPVRMFEEPPPILPTFGKQLKHVLGAIISLIDPMTPFDLASYQRYDTHLWTMPVEFYSSIMLYTVLLATSRLMVRYRLLIHGFLSAFCLFGGHPTQGLFLTGMTMAEIDLLAKKRAEIKRTSISISASQNSSIFSSYLTISNIFSFSSFMTGLHLLSLPIVYGEETHGFITIIKMLPAYLSLDQRFQIVRAFGAIMIVWPITYSSMTADPSSISFSFIQKILANPITSYLGKISFGMYLVHGFVIRSIGYTIMPSISIMAIPNPDRRKLLRDITTSKEEGIKLTPREVGTIWVLGYLIVLPVSIWAADFFWRIVDVKLGPVAQWVEETLTQIDGTDIDNTEKTS